MKSNWADKFYKMQFGNMSAIDTSYYEEQAKEILEQTGRKIDSLLELGAWGQSGACAFKRCKPYNDGGTR